MGWLIPVHAVLGPGCAGVYERGRAAVPGCGGPSVIGSGPGPGAGLVTTRAQCGVNTSADCFKAPGIIDGHEREPPAHWLELLPGSPPGHGAHGQPPLHHDGRRCDRLERRDGRGDGVRQAVDVVHHIARWGELNTRLGIWPVLVGDQLRVPVRLSARVSLLAPGAFPLKSACRRLQRPPSDVVGLGGALS